MRELAVFGSALGEDRHPESDVDLLVSFQPVARVTFVTLAKMQRELQALLGRKVDLVPTNGLKPVIRDHVLATRTSSVRRVSFLGPVLINRISRIPLPGPPDEPPFCRLLFVPLSASSLFVSRLWSRRIRCGRHHYEDHVHRYQAVLGFS